MGDLTRAQLRTEVAANLGGRDDLESGDPLNTVNRALDRVQTRIARANINGWSELKQMTTETINIDNDPTDNHFMYKELPDNLDKIQGLMIKHTGDTYAYRIQELLRSQWDSYISVTSSWPHGRILAYTDEYFGIPSERVLRFWPPADMSYSLYKYFRYKPTPFADDDAVSDYEDKDDLILAGTTHYMFNRYQAFEEAEEWRKNYGAALNEAVKMDRLKPDVHAILLGANPTSHPRGAPINPWQDPFVTRNRR
jgi:hypothetical protein